MPANSAFLQNWLEPLIGGWLYADSPMWTVIGFMGAAIFGSRFILQWLQTEKEKKLVVPWHFWHFSFWGSLLNLLYFLHLDKAPLILGNCFLPFIYGRSIFFLRKDGAKGQGRKVFALVATMMVVGFVWSIVWPNRSVPMGVPIELRKASTAEKNMKAALWSFQEYLTEYKTQPLGDSRAIFKQLNGANPRHIQFLTVDPNDISGVGDWLDPWKHPYRIYTSGDSILIHSAGKNGSFETSRSDIGDDIIVETYN